MSNQMTVIDNTSADPRNWKVNYIVDNPGTSIATLDTAGTFVDRNIQIAVNTPAGGATVSGGALSVSANYSTTPDLNVTLDGQTTTGITIQNNIPSSGYYVQITSKTSADFGTTTVTSDATSLTLTSGYVSGQTFSSVINSSSVSPTVTISSAIQTSYLKIPTATFMASGASIYSSAAGWVTSGQAINSITVGEVIATTTAVSNASVAMAPHGLGVGSSSSPYYITINSTAGSVTPRAEIVSDGYVTEIQNTNGDPVGVDIDGADIPLYLPTATIAGSVINLSSGSVAITSNTSGITLTTGSTTSQYSITIGANVTSGSVKGRATAGATTGIIAANSINTSNASTITPSVSGTKTIYIKPATITYSSSTLTAGTGSVSLNNGSGYYNGTNYDTTDKITLSTTKTSGYYEITAAGSGMVTQNGYSLQIEEGYISSINQSGESNSQTSLSSSKSYYIKKSTHTALSVNSSSTAQQITVTSGYYPTDRTIAVAAMPTRTPTTSYANSGISTYFSAGTSSDYNISITPRYSNEAGYVATHNNTNNGGIGYWKITTAQLSQGSTTTSGDTATRGVASIASSGWIQATTIPAAKFSNTATTGISYIDISNTTDAPILVSNGYLYIDKGYTDYLKISLAKLVPDGASTALASNHILSGYSAYNNDGVLVAGNIASKTSATYNTSSSDQTISSGQYLSGDQTIRAVTTSNITAANIKKGVTVKVGDSASAGRIINLTGTFTSAGTQSAGQTVATSAQMLSGYSAWVNGNEVKGNIATKTTGNITESFTSTTGYINIPQGYFSEASSFTLSNGAYSADSSTSTNSTVTPSVSINNASTYGFTTSQPSGTNGTNYLTIDPGASATNWSVTPRAKITTSGYLPTGNKTGTAVSGSPTINAGTNYYIPMASYSFSCGTTTAAISSNTISVTNIQTTATNTGFKVDASATGTYDFGTITYTNTAGVSSAHATAQTIKSRSSGNLTTKSSSIYIQAAAINSTGSISNITVTAAPGTVSIADNNTAVTGKTRLTTSNFTIGTTTANISTYYIALKATAAANSVGTTGSISGTTTASISTEGYAPTTLTTSASLSGTATAKTSSKDSSVYYIAIPSSTISSTSITPSTDTQTVTVSSGYYASDRTITIGSMDAGGTGSITPGFNNANLTTYFNTTSNSTGSISITPKYSNTAGYIGAHTNTTGATSYYNIKTATFTTDGASVKCSTAGWITSGTTAGTIGTATLNASLSNNTSGSAAISTTLATGTSANSTYYVSLVTTPGSVTPKAGVTTAGYVSTSTSATGSATSVGVTGNGDKLYIAAATVSTNGGTVSVTNYSGKPVVTLASGSSTNMANITMGAQDTTNYPYYFKVQGNTSALSGSTTVSMTSATVSYTSGYTTARTTTAKAAFSSSPTVTVSASDTASSYVSLKKATMTVAKSTGTITPTASMAGTNATLSDTNNGIAIVATGGGSASLTATATTNAAGYAPASTQLGSASLSISSTTTAATKYISGVKLTAPTSGTRSFTITVPNGSTADFIDFVFTVDTSGNVTVAGP